VFEVNLADLRNDKVAFRHFRLITEDDQGKNCLTNFYGMDLTCNKMPIFCFLKREGEEKGWVLGCSLILWLLPAGGG
jgi:hypothetical protein